MKQHSARRKQLGQRAFTRASRSQATETAGSVAGALSKCVCTSAGSKNPTAGPQRAGGRAANLELKGAGGDIRHDRAWVVVQADRLAGRELDRLDSKLPRP